MAAEVQRLSSLLDGSPKNWGRWGEDDEVGALNFLTSQEVIAAASCIRQGEVHTLQVPMANPEGDPVFGDGRLVRHGAQRYVIRDKSSYDAGRIKETPGGMQSADDVMFCFLQGSTQYDALGHVWYDGELWNGYPAETTIGGLARVSVLPIAERGVVGRGVLLDMARHRGKERLDPGEPYSHEDLLACAAAQGVEIRKRDIILVRTGYLSLFYTDRAKFAEDVRMPGLEYSRELVEWFHEMEIPSIGNDTFGNEVLTDPDRVDCPLHCALMRNLGVTFAEVLWLEGLAGGCLEHSQYDFMYVAAPLKVVAAAGSPVNPVAIL
jgi:kynurenine formamidase